MLAGVHAAFLPDQEKKTLVAEFEAELDAAAEKLGLDWGPSAAESQQAAAAEVAEEVASEGKFATS